MTLSLNSKRTPPPPHQGTFNHRFTIIGPLFAAFASALSLTACPSPGGGGKNPAPTTYTTTITGTVQDASRTGLGLPGAAVSVSTKPEPTTTTTGPDGTFSLQVTHSGSLSLTLTAEKACYETAPLKSVTLTKNTPYDAEVIELTPVPEPTGSARFTLKQNPGTAANPTYTLTIADCVRNVTPGEFASDPSSGPTSITSNTRLAGRLGTRPRNRVTAIELPDTLRTIGRDAFHQHFEVTGEFTIPAAVESIGSGAFQYIGQSGQIRLRFAQDSRLKTIGVIAFNQAGISAMPPLPQSLETIGRRAFEDAFASAAGSSLSNFVIPENVRSVGDYAFGSTVFSGTLTIRSPHLTRTPTDTAQTRTGRLAISIFTEGSETLTQKFTKIVIPRAVFTSYTQTDLNAIFGPGGNYVDLADGTTALDITTLTP